jgi:hypothetical protein
MVTMRTTIDLPDDLFRQVKARASLRGMKLKDYVTEALRDSLYRHGPASEIRETQTKYGDTLVLSDDCVLPVIRGATTEELRSITEQRIDEILEDEEVEDALSPGRR